MKLNQFISVIDADTNVNIIIGSKRTFYGDLRRAYMELPEKYFAEAEVISAKILLSALVIEAVLD